MYLVPDWSELHGIFQGFILGVRHVVVGNHVVNHRADVAVKLSKKILPFTSAFDQLLEPCPYVNNIGSESELLLRRLVFLSS